MPLSYYLALIVFIILISIIAFSTTPRKHSLIGIMLLLPFMDFPIVPIEYGGFKVFHGVSAGILLVCFGDLTSQKVLNRPLSGLFVALFFILLIGAIWSKFPVNALVSTLTLLSIFIFAGLLFNECYQNPGFQELVLNSLKIVCLISIVMILIQMAFGLEFTFYRGLNRNTENLMGFRYPSFFHDPQKYGHFLCLTAFLFLYNRNRPGELNIWNLVFFLFLIGAILTTGSRSSFFGSVVGMGFLFWFLGTRYKLFLALLVIGFFAIKTYSGEAIMLISRSKTIEDDLLFRASIWDEAFLFFKSNPIFGIGYGNYYNFSILKSENFFINEGNEIVFFDQPESGYWMILTECGIIGFILLLGFVLRPVYSSLVNWFNGGCNFMDLLIIAGLFSWLVAFTTVYSLSDIRILIVVTCLLVFLSLNKNNSHYG